MANGEYFFLVFLVAIVVTRLLLATRKMAKPTIKGFRLRHYMYGMVLIAFGYFFNNLTVFAIGSGLFADEIPLIIIKGPGHKDEYWRGCEDYYTPWCVAGILIIILVVYTFRNTIAALI
ncbi:MAG: hypothetical protein AAB410_04835 [Patescibacteria group bacterium]